ncbi:MAG: bifunctional ADP-dependent (S)-NAD(P)H-hydrate dehydratase/NAD(P)H-hydrate epimerase [Legionellales bacterium RIFCSPHIGHO2_12_FULL_42_9]|nr:MAG: bifunctional ADP-dependent (S)-NAD(P)H-hydrate dehydratase/NAD(P)H-hydrate epimerase [Legionellales bacterium RIFCSPHIGHO2_12_FULL_42_9]
MTKPTQAIYRSSQIRWCEKMAIQTLNLSVDELMLRAGTAAWKVLRREFPKAHKLAIFCGGGNNAGDGFVLARLAHEEGYVVTVYQFKAFEKLPDAARHAALQAIAAGVFCTVVEEHLDPDTDLIVDALLGIGLAGEVREPLLTAINQINEAEIPVMALDIPSGLSSDEGRVLGECVRASLTVTFFGKKLGMLMCDGPDVCGRIVVDSLQLDSLLSSITAEVACLSSAMIANLLPRRRRNCHKGDFGHVLIVGGNVGMPGAVVIAALAALRVGAGLVTIATKPQHTNTAVAQLPEAMVYGIEQPDELQRLLDKATVCLIGPGLGEDVWATELFFRVIGSHLPMVVDAEALRILGASPQHDDNWVLTPHPGEAASLLQCTTMTIQRDRYAALHRLHQQYGGAIVLKGVGSLIGADDNQTFICDRGNPGMASPGMGDALSGVIAGLIAQGLSLVDAAKLGVYVHARAADLAVTESGERGLLATDLLPFMRQLINNEVV